MSFTVQQILDNAVRRIRDFGYTALAKQEDYIDALNEALRRMVMELRLQHKRVSLSISSNQQMIILPDDFIDFFMPYLTYNFTDADYNYFDHRVPIVPYESLLRRMPDLFTRRGTPTECWINNNEIGFYPTPFFQSGFLITGDAHQEGTDFDLEFQVASENVTETLTDNQGGVFWVVGGNAFSESDITNEWVTFDYYYLPPILTQMADLIDIQHRYFEPLTYLTAAMIMQWTENYEQESIMLSQYTAKLWGVQGAGALPLNDKYSTANSYFGG